MCVKYVLAHFIAKYFGARSQEPGAGSREPGAVKREDELKTSKKASQDCRRTAFAETQKGLAQKRGLFLFPSKFRIADWKNKNAGNGGVSETNAHASERS